MNQITTELVQSVFENRLDEAMNASSSNLTREIAEDARKAFLEATDARDASTALATALVASRVYAHLGDRQSHLLNLIDFWQVRFMVAITVQQYDSVRKALLSMLNLTDQAALPKLGFHAAVIAADSAFFAAEASNEKWEWLSLCLHDVISAFDRTADFQNDRQFLRLVDLAASLVSKITPRVLATDQEEERRALLRRLSAQIDRLVPENFESPGNPQESARIATILTELTADYGVPSSRADARLEFAIHLAEESNDAYAWLLAVGARYGRAKSGRAPAATLAAMRVSLWSRSDALRAQFRSRAARLWVGQVVEHTMAALFRDEIALGDTPPARIFYMMETVKARTLLDQMHLPYVDLPEELKEQGRAIERSMRSFSDDSQTNGIAAEIALTSQLSIDERTGKSVEEPVRAIESLYRQANAGFNGVQSVRSLEEIQQALAPREALIEFAIPLYPLNPAAYLYALAITRETVFEADFDLTTLPSTFTGTLRVDDKAPMDSSALGEKIVAVRTAIQQGNDVKADMYLEQLHAILIAPLLKSGLDFKNYDRLIIVPHRLLHSVPWGALRAADGGRRLIQDIALAFAPSASIWHRLVSAAPIKTVSYLALANPRPLPDPQLPPLPQAEAEVDEIGRELAELEVTVLKNKEATESAFREQVPGKSIVHLATHGAFPAQNALDFHQFLLAPGNGQDGYMRAEELRSLNFRCAFLVVLSICNGGIYRFGPGDEPYGLLPALAAAGARNVVGTLWGIEDTAGRLFMVEFYSKLLSYGPAEAIRRAACRFIDAGWDLRRWAAFLTAGPARSSNVTQGNATA